MMEIDRRIRAKEFMRLLAIGNDKFYDFVKYGAIQQPVRQTEKDVFWYSSYVRNKVEERKA